MQSKHVLCQVNIAHMLYPAEHPEMKDFFDAIEMINALADKAPGFLWRFVEAKSCEPSPWPDDVLPNLSVWRDIESLMDYVYRTDHSLYLRRKGEWFQKMPGPHLALWWAPEGHTPTLAEAKQRLESLEQLGPSPEAFTLARRFAAPSAVLAD